MKSYEQLSTIANVVAGGDVTINLPVGNVYSRLFLYYTGMTADLMKNIVLQLNSRLVSHWKNGSRIQSIDDYYDRPSESGILVFNFERREMRTTQEQRFFGLDLGKTSGVTIAEIKMDIDGTASSPTLVAVAEKMGSIPGQPNWLTKVRRISKTLSASGEFEIDNLPRPAGASIAAIHLFKSDISKVELLVDNVKWWNLTKTQGENIESLSGRVPQTSDMTTIDLIQDNELSQGLALTKNIQDLRLRCVADSSGPIDIVIEYFDMWSINGF